MNGRRWGLVALAVAGAAWAFGGEFWSIYRSVPENHFLDLLPGLTFIGAGIVALDRRPGNRLGVLMVVAGFSWYFGNWSNIDIAVVSQLCYILGQGIKCLLVWIVLAYPTGHLAGWLDRLAVAAALVFAIGWETARVLVWVRPAACDCGGGARQFLPSPAAFALVEETGPYLTVVAVLLAVASLARRWLGATPTDRRELWPMWTNAGLIALSFLAASVAELTSQKLAAFIFDVRTILITAVPVIFLVGLLTSYRARSSVGNLVLELRKPTAPAGLAALLAATVGDPSLRIRYAGDSGQWVDEQGRCSPAPTADPTTHRAVTVLERDGTAYAALMHRDDVNAELISGVATAAGMAIENERLHTQVQAQLAEVERSRARIVAAGDDERRRVERNLHDGAQQRLVTLSLALSRAGRQVAAGDPAAGRTMAAASKELRQAISELRDLARGIHPAVLTEAGLAAAVRSAGGRCSIPVTVDIPDDRFPETLETTAFYVISEALTNVVKHSGATVATVRATVRASRLTIEVIDNGCGIAGINGTVDGSGLSGMRDRVATARGDLQIAGYPGGGTTVRVALPLPTGGD